MLSSTFTCPGHALGPRAPASPSAKESAMLSSTGPLIALQPSDRSMQRQRSSRQRHLEVVVVVAAGRYIAVT